MALNGKEQEKLHLQIEWTSTNGSKQKDYSWEPFVQISRDQPALVREYFDDKGLRVEEIFD